VLIEQIPLAINNLNTELISIYPNPVNNYIMLKGDQNIINSITDATLINRNGSYFTSTQIQSNTFFFSNQNLTPGIYILSLKTFSNIYTYKIIKS